MNAAQPEIAAYDGRRFLGGYDNRGARGLFCFDANGKRIAGAYATSKEALAAIAAAKPKPTMKDAA